MWQLDAARGTGALAAWTGLDGTGRAHTACGCTSPDTQQATGNTHTHLIYSAQWTYTHILLVSHRDLLSPKCHQLEISLCWHCADILQCFTNGWLCINIACLWNIYSYSKKNKSQCPTYTTYKQNKNKHIQINGKSPNPSPSTLSINSHKEMCQTQKIWEKHSPCVLSDPVPSLYKDLTLLIVH